jgi:cytochrome c-type biogenesis protein CcmE
MVTEATEVPPIDGVAADDGTTDAAAVRARRRRGEIDDGSSQNPWLRRALVFGMAASAAGLAALFLLGMKDKAIYAKPVDQLVAEKAKFIGRPVRAEGLLVHGSLVKRDAPCEYRFTLQKNGTEVPVRFAQCVVPDTFRDMPGMDVGVTVEGTLAADDSFEASSVLAKCPSKYEMKEKQKSGEMMPHGPTAANP